MSATLVDEIEVEAAILFATQLIDFCYANTPTPRVACFGLMQTFVSLTIVARKPGVTIADARAAAIEEIGHYFDNAIARKAKEL